MIHSFHASQAKDHGPHGREQPLILLAEPCDKVFRRLETSLTEVGLRVVRARSAGEAYLLSTSHQPHLVIANVDLPDQNGWFLASQLQFSDSATRLWFYQSDFNAFEVGMASCLQVQKLLEFGEDIGSLSAQLQALLNETLSLSNDINRVSQAI